MCRQVSIVPRGSAALGFAQYLPSENLLMTTEQMRDMTCMALGGRAAEQVLLGKISTGAIAPPAPLCPSCNFERMGFLPAGSWDSGMQCGLIAFCGKIKRAGRATASAITRAVCHRHGIKTHWQRCV